MDVDFKINGLAELNKELKKLPDEIRTKTLNGAVGAATRHLRDLAIQGAPVDSGNLKTAIFAGIAPKSERYTKWISKYRVGIRKRGKITVLGRGKSRRSNSTYYARFLEDGTAKMPAQPFMRPAFDAGKREAVRIFQRTLDRKITLANKKIGRLRK